MRKTWMIVVLGLVVLLAGCTVPVSDPPAERPLPPTSENTMSDDDDLPEAAPAFAAHFTDPLYSDPADDFAPFGSDEGWDMLYDWADRRDELHQSTTVADLIDESGFDGVLSELDVEEAPGIPAPAGQIDAATITVGAGFTLLRLTGRIDAAGRQQTLKALDVLIRHYGSQRELAQQRADLESWRG